MADVFKRHLKCGPGGWKCACCGPAPKDRPLARREARRRLKNEDRKTFKQTDPE